MSYTCNFRTGCRHMDNVCGYSVEVIFVLNILKPICYYIPDTSLHLFQCTSSVKAFDKLRLGLGSFDNLEKIQFY